MTTRLKALTVILDSDIREDDAESLIAAIRQLRGVGTVESVEASSTDYYARQRVALDCYSNVAAAVRAAFFPDGKK